jgi:hypothetical protein
MKKIILISAIMLVMLLQLPVIAENKTEEKDSFEFSIGTKVFYSSGISADNIYYKPYGEVKYTYDFVEAMAGGYRYQEYQITDGLGNYKNIGFNQGGLKLTFTILDKVEVSGGYLYAFGDASFKRSDYSGGLGVNFGLINISGDYEGRLTEYTFSLNTIKTAGNNYSGEIELVPSEKISFDLGYEYSEIIFKNLDSKYYNNIVRLGIIPKPADNISLIGGLSAGIDSAKYWMFGFDCGAEMMLMDRIKLSAVYDFAYHAKQSSIISTGGGKGGGSGSGMHSNTNPYLKSSIRDKSYYSHLVSAGVAVVF